VRPEKAESTLNLLVKLDLEGNHTQRTVAHALLKTHLCSNLVTLMHQNMDVLHIQTKACSLIVSFTFVHSAFQHAFLKANAPVTIVLAMQQFPRHSDMQKSGCGALRNLAGCEPGAHKVAEAGAIETICSAMNHFPQDGFVQYEACGALRNMACNYPASIQAIIQNGGIRAVLDAMLYYPQDIDIQYCIRFETS
jgi:hypothetical protein